MHQTRLLLWLLYGALGKSHKDRRGICDSTIDRGTDLSTRCRAWLILRHRIVVVRCFFCNPLGQAG